MYKNSVAIIRTRKDTIVGCHMVAARKYIQLMPCQFDYKNTYVCDSFELLENVGGDVIGYKLESGCEKFEAKGNETVEKIEREWRKRMFLPDESTELLAKTLMKSDSERGKINER